MYKILEKKLLAENIYAMRIEAPRVAHAALPGQFVIVRADATGERVPFAMLRERDCDIDNRAELARAMRSEGKTLQEIADALGYKSVSSVHNLITKS